MEHLIAPSLEMVDKCRRQFIAGILSVKEIVEIAFQAGADAELEACDAMVARSGEMSTGYLTSMRRPTPPSLKEQAFQELMDCEVHYTIELNIIRQALEALPNDN